jgi:hypothetical protein
METRRARSVDRLLGSGTGPGEADLLGRLTVALERMSQGDPDRQRTHFKTPTYEGKGDVEYFIQQFTEVSAANHWEEAAALLHLRETLKEGARDCGRSRTIEGIFTALRARYGFSPREARSRLGALKRDNQTTLQEHGSEIQRLVNVAYADLPVCHQNDMIIDTFCSTVGNAYLQRHLLAVPTRTLEEAVQAGNEFLQIKLYPARNSVRVVDEEEDEPLEDGPGVSQVGTHPRKSQAEELIAPLVTLMQQLTEQVQQLQGAAGIPREPVQSMSSQVVMCWHCGKSGHLKRRCPAMSGGRNSLDNRQSMSGGRNSPNNGPPLSGGWNGLSNRWQQGAGHSQPGSGGRNGLDNRPFPSGGRNGPNNGLKQGNGHGLQ